MTNRQDAKSVMRKEPSKETDRLAHAVIGAAIQVHRSLGPGFLESVYEQALCVEFQLREIPFKRQSPISIDYKGQIVGEGRIDLLIGKELIVELKAVEMLAPIHVAQLISYLKITGH